MIKKIPGYWMSDSREDMKISDVATLLSTTYWSEGRTQKEMEESIEKSLCFGLFSDSGQIGFARVVTDDVSVYWLCDVVIHEEYRGQGLGKIFLDFILKDHTYRGLGILITEDAHHLYERYGFERNREHFMMKS